MAESRLASASPDVQQYVAAVADEIHAVFDAGLVGVYTTGSLALGGFTAGRSDIDLMAVVDGDGRRDQCLTLAARLDHSRLPCPATGLELVVYPSVTVTSPTTDGGYLLNLNTGAELAPVANLDPGVDPAFWFVIDRAVTAQSGEAVTGPPPQDFFRPPSWAELLPVVLAAVEAQEAARSDLLDNVVLNAARALRFAEDRRWYSKMDAARLTAATPGPFTGLLDAALATHRQGRGAGRNLPPATVDAFLALVRDRLEHAVRAAG